MARILSIPRSEKIRERLREVVEEAARLKLLLNVATELERIPQRPTADLERDIAADMGQAHREVQP